MTRDGYPFVFGSAALAALFITLWQTLGGSVVEYLAYVFIILTLFNINFFRDPDAKDSSTDDQIISPAQGTVIQLAEIDHDDYIGGPATRISIFLSVFNIHVNSHPMKGTVTLFEYRKGKMLAAFDPNSSEQNEQTIIGIDNGRFRIVHKQITGLIARRIICRVEEGQKVLKGERFGMIRFGSRCDVIVPKAMTVTVQKGDSVERGETVIGEWHG